jgi:hypothetical protein
MDLRHRHLVHQTTYESLNQDWPEQACKHDRPNNQYLSTIKNQPIRIEYERQTFKTLPCKSIWIAWKWGSMASIWIELI